MFYNEKEGHQQVLGLGIRKNQEEMPGHFISRPERCSVIYVSALVLACVQGGQLSNQNPNKHAPDTRRPEPAATETASPTTPSSCARAALSLMQQCFSLPSSWAHKSPSLHFYVGVDFAGPWEADRQSNVGLIRLQATYLSHASVNSKGPGVTLLGQG